MKLRQHSQQVFEAIKQGGKRSIRKIAEATGIAKSSVHRHQQAIIRRNQYEEVRILVNGSRGAMAEAAGARNNLHLWHQVWHRGGDDVRVLLSVAIALCR